MEEDNVEDLWIIAKKDDRYYNAFGISSTETNGIFLKNTGITAEDKL